MATVNSKLNQTIHSQKDTQQISIKESQVQVPTDQQSRYAKTIQTHNAVSVPASGWSSSSWIDTQNFDKLSLSLKSDASTSNQASISWSHDAVSEHGADNVTDVMPALGALSRSKVVDTKARYAKINIYNGDTVAHIMSSWAYLKA